jgi:hypothetical protein
MSSRATLKVRPERPIHDLCDTYALAFRLPVDHPHERFLDVIGLAQGVVQGRTHVDQLHPLGIVKLPMAPLAHPKNVGHAFIKNPLIGQVGALLAIPTQANLALALRPYANGTSQRPPARRLQVARVLGIRLGGLLLASAVYR